MAASGGGRRNPSERAARNAPASFSHFLAVFSLPQRRGCATPGQHCRAPHDRRPPPPPLPVVRHRAAERGSSGRAHPHRALPRQRRDQCLPGHAAEDHIRRGPRRGTHRRSAHLQGRRHAGGNGRPRPERRERHPAPDHRRHRLQRLPRAGFGRHRDHRPAQRRARVQHDLLRDPRRRLVHRSRRRGGLDRLALHHPRGGAGGRHRASHRRRRRHGGLLHRAGRGGLHPRRQHHAPVHQHPQRHLRRDRARHRPAQPRLPRPAPTPHRHPLRQQQQPQCLDQHPAAVQRGRERRLVRQPDSLQRDAAGRLAGRGPARQRSALRGEQRRSAQLPGHLPGQQRGRFGLLRQQLGGGQRGLHLGHGPRGLPALRNQVARQRLRLPDAQPGGTDRGGVPRLPLHPPARREQRRARARGPQHLPRQPGQPGGLHPRCTHHRGGLAAQRRGTGRRVALRGIPQHHPRRRRGRRLRTRGLFTADRRPDRHRTAQPSRHSRRLDARAAPARLPGGRGRGGQRPGRPRRRRLRRDLAGGQRRGDAARCGDHRARRRPHGRVQGVGQHRTGLQPHPLQTARHHRRPDRPGRRHLPEKLHAAPRRRRRRRPPPALAPRHRRRARGRRRHRLGRDQRHGRPLLRVVVGRRGAQRHRHRRQRHPAMVHGHRGSARLHPQQGAARLRIAARRPPPRPLFPPSQPLRAQPEPQPPPGQPRRHDPQLRLPQQRHLQLGFLRRL